MKPDTRICRAPEAAQEHDRRASEFIRSPEWTAALELASTGSMPEGWAWNDGSTGQHGALMRIPSAAEPAC